LITTENIKVNTKKQNEFRYLIVPWKYTKLMY
jgi:hypothetical protein